MKKLLFVALTLLCFASCSIAVRTGGEAPLKPVASGNVELILLQLNDVYEISPVEGGKYGGIARLAIIRQELRTENPNTFMFLAGDFISPSAIGTSSYQGKRINGAQMIDALNSAGLDFVTFGNHEFDLGEEPLLDRINQSKFLWIASNIKHKTASGVRPFQKNVGGKIESFPESHILTVTNAAGEALRIGILGVTLGSNKPSYIEWSDPIESAVRVYSELKAKTDFVIGLTHLSIEDDKKLAERIPELKVILGGHEHTNMLFKVGETIISKADANVRTVYIHRLVWSSKQKSLRILSEIRTLDASVSEDSATAKVVNEWTTRAYAGFQEKGFSPEEIVTRVSEPLDGRESSIRHKQTNLGVVIANAMIAASSKANIGIFNSGSIRLDDQLAGIITQYDIIRTMPYGGKIIEVEMKGSLLTNLLDAGRANAGRGGYLQYQGVRHAEGKWLLADGNPIVPTDRYRVIVSDYLFSGNEQGIEFFKRSHPDVVAVEEPSDPADVRRDIRLAVIRYLKEGK